MSGDHPHMQDLEGHVEAVASDLEYFRRKRIEPRVLLYLRRGIIDWSDLFRGHDLEERPPRQSLSRIWRRASGRWRTRSTN